MQELCDRRWFRLDDRAQSYVLDMPTLTARGTASCSAPHNPPLEAGKKAWPAPSDRRTIPLGCTYDLEEYCLKYRAMCGPMRRVRGIRPCRRASRLRQPPIRRGTPRHRRAMSCAGSQSAAGCPESCRLTRPGHSRAAPAKRLPETPETSLTRFSCAIHPPHPQKGSGKCGNPLRCRFDRCFCRAVPGCLRLAETCGNSPVETLVAPPR
jgi:hypothetical protein